MSNQTFFYPQVSRLPGAGGVSDAGLARPASEGPSIQKGEFDEALKKAAQEGQKVELNSIQPNLGSENFSLKFSAHAMQRLRDRQIQFDSDTLGRMNDAIRKADSKGLQDTLLLTEQAALIVNVPNRTVVTAMDREKLIGNVFTNIDGAIII